MERVQQKPFIRLRETGRVGILQPGETKVKGDLIHVGKYLKGGYKNDREKLFSVVPSDGSRGNREKLKRLLNIT